MAKLTSGRALEISVECQARAWRGAATTPVANAAPISKAFRRDRLTDPSAKCEHLGEPVIFALRVIYHCFGLASYIGVAEWKAPATFQPTASRRRSQTTPLCGRLRISISMVQREDAWCQLKGGRMLEATYSMNHPGRSLSRHSLFRRP